MLTLLLAALLLPACIVAGGGDEHDRSPMLGRHSALTPGARLLPFANIVRRTANLGVAAFISP